MLEKENTEYLKELTAAREEVINIYKNTEK